jgi:hypothetical protein
MPDLSGATWVRVKDKISGHKYSVVDSVAAADPDAYQVLKQDAVDHVGQPLPPEFADASPQSSASTSQKENS